MTNITADVGLVFGVDQKGSLELIKNGLKEVIKELEQKGMVPQVKFKLDSEDLKKQLNNSINTGLKGQKGEVNVGVKIDESNIKKAAKKAAETVKKETKNAGNIDIAIKEKDFKQIQKIRKGMVSQKNLRPESQDKLGTEYKKTKDQIKELNAALAKTSNENSKIVKLKEKISALSKEEKYITEKTTIQLEKQRAAAISKLQGVINTGNKTATSKQGKLMLDDLQTWLNSLTLSGERFGDDGVYLTNIKKQITEIQRATGQVQVELGQLGDTAKTAGEEIWTGFINKTKTTVYSMILTFTSGMLYKIIDSITNIKTSMANLRVVINATEKTFSDFADTATEKAKKLGVNIDDLIDSVTEYVRLGYTLKESTVFAELTSMFSSVAQITVEDATSYITSIIKGYNIAAEDLGTTLDKLMVVANNYAVSPAELGVAMKNAASSLYANGNTIEEAMGILSAANATLQNASKSSTAVRTIAARISHSLADLEDLGEDQASIVTTSVLQNRMSAMGVQIVDINGELRSTYDILNDTAAVWDDLSSTQKAAVADMYAGVRQQNAFYSIMNNWADATGAVEDCKTAVGLLENSHAELMDTIEGKVGQLTATWEGLSQTIMDSEIIMFALDALNGFVGTLDSIMNLGNGAVMHVAVLTGSLFALSKAAGAVNKVMQKSATLKLYERETGQKMSSLITVGKEHVDYQNQKALYDATFKEYQAKLGLGKNATLNALKVKFGINPEVVITGDVKDRANKAIQEYNKEIQIYQDKVNQYYSKSKSPIVLDFEKQAAEQGLKDKSRAKLRRSYLDKPRQQARKEVEAQTKELLSAFNSSKENIRIAMESLYEVDHGGEKLTKPIKLASETQKEFTERTKQYQIECMKYGKKVKNLGGAYAVLSEETKKANEAQTKWIGATKTLGNTLNTVFSSGATWTIILSSIASGLGKTSDATWAVCLGIGVLTAVLSKFFKFIKTGVKSIPIVGWFLIAAEGIMSIVNALDAWINANSYKKLAEVAETARDEWQETANELENVQSELKSIDDQIAELQAKGSLTLVDQEELNRLKEARALLEMEEGLTQEEEKEQRKKAAEASIKASNAAQNTSSNIRRYKTYQETWKAQSGRPISQWNEIAYLSNEEKFNSLVADYNNLSDSDKNWVKDYASKLKTQMESFTYQRGDNLEDWQILLNQELDEYYKAMDMLNITLGSHESVLKTLLDGSRSDKYTEATDKIKKLAEEGNLPVDYFSKVLTGEIQDESIKQFLEYLDEIGLISVESSQDVQLLGSQIMQLFNQDIYSKESYTDYIDSLITKFDMLSQAIQDMKDMGVLSVDTIKELFNEMPALAEDLQNLGLLTIGKDGYVLSMDALEKYFANKQEELNNEKIQAEKTLAEIQAKYAAGTLADIAVFGYERNEDGSYKVDSNGNLVGEQKISITYNNAKTAYEAAQKALDNAISEGANEEFVKNLTATRDTAEQIMKNAAANSPLQIANQNLENITENISTLGTVINNLFKETLIDNATEKLEELTEALEKQRDIQQEIVDARKELLETYKEESDYQKDLEDKQKAVASLQTRLALAQLDTSASGQAAARELQEELEDAQEDLSEFTLEHAIEELTKQIDEEYEEYSNAIDAKLTSIEDTIENIGMLEVDALRAISKGEPYETRHSGGFIGSAKLKNNEEFAKLIRGELVVTPRQMSNFMNSTLPQIQSLGQNNIQYNSPLIEIKCESISKDSLPELEKVVNKAVQKVKDEINSVIDRNGKKRPFDKFKI